MKDRNSCAMDMKERTEVLQGTEDTAWYQTMREIIEKWNANDGYLRIVWCFDFYDVCLFLRRWISQRCTYDFVLKWCQDCRTDVCICDAILAKNWSWRRHMFWIFVGTGLAISTSFWGQRERFNFAVVWKKVYAISWALWNGDWAYLE